MSHLYSSSPRLRLINVSPVFPLPQAEKVLPAVLTGHVQPQHVLLTQDLNAHAPAHTKKRGLIDLDKMLNVTGEYVFFVVAGSGSEVQILELIFPTNGCENIVINDIFPSVFYIFSEDSDHQKSPKVECLHEKHGTLFSSNRPSNLQFTKVPTLERMKIRFICKYL
jgi:hypothetical protein